MHALEVAEDLGAEIEHDLLAGPLHEVGLDELQAEAEGEGGEVDEGKLSDAVSGVRTETAAKPAGVWDAVEVGVDGDLGEVRPAYIADGFEEDGERGGSGGELVGLEVAEETAHEGAVVGFADYVVVDAGALGGLLLLFLVGHCYLF